MKSVKSLNAIRQQGGLVVEAGVIKFSSTAKQGSRAAVKDHSDK